MKYMKPMNLFKEWRRNPLNGGRLLGLYIHDKAVHLAVSGPDNEDVSAIPIPREEYYMDLMVDKFQTLISEYNLIGFVVEYPYKESDLCRVEEIKKFINDLSKIRNFQSLKYTYWEESIATEDMDFVVEHHVEFILENLKPDLESKSKQIVKDFVVKKFVAARLLQISNLSLRGIVVGCSININLGKLNVEREKILIDELRKTGKFKGLNYTYWNKRLKSKIVERGVLENINASGSTFPQDMPKAEIEEKLQKRREELVDVYMASFVLQGFVDYGRLSSDKDRKGKMAERRLSSNKDRKGKMAERVPVIRLLGV